MQESTALANYDAKKYNMLMPNTDIQQLSPLHRMVVTSVTIDPNPENGEVFPVENKAIKKKNEQTGKEWTEYVPAFSLVFIGAIPFITFRIVFIR